MKLSSKGRYAVMALADLAKFDPKEPVSLRDISLRQGISLVYLEQLFLKLKISYAVLKVHTILVFMAMWNHSDPSRTRL